MRVTTLPGLYDIFVGKVVQRGELVSLPLGYRDDRGSSEQICEHIPSDNLEL